MQSPAGGCEPKRLSDLLDVALYRLSEYNFNRTDRVVLDTNVLLLIHYGIGVGPQDPRLPAYSGVVSKVIQRQSETVVLDVTLSEFINAAERISGKDWAYRQGLRSFGTEELKRFRASGSPYRTTIKDIEQGVDQILKSYKLDRAGYHPNDSLAILAEMSTKKVDFNDVLIARYCQVADACIITDDGDFQVYAQHVDIISNRAPVD